MAAVAAAEAVEAEREGRAADDERARDGRQGQAEPMPAPAPGHVAEQALDGRLEQLRLGIDLLEAEAGQEAGQAGEGRELVAAARAVGQVLLDLGALRRAEGPEDVGAQVVAARAAALGPQPVVHPRSSSSSLRLRSA